MVDSVHEKLIPRVFPTRADVGGSKSELKSLSICFTIGINFS